MYPDNISLLKKLQELFSERKKTLNPKTQAQEFRQLITQIVILQRMIERHDNQLTDEEESLFQKLHENNKNYDEEETICTKLILLLHKCRNRQDIWSHIELAKIFADDGFYEEAAKYYRWVIANSKDNEFLGIAYHSLGLLYSQEKLQSDDGSKNRFEVAVDWFTRATNTKFLLAYFELGCLYEKELKFQSAKKFYIEFVNSHDPHKACGVEVQYAIYRYARMVALGLGMEKDLTEAKNLYGKLVEVYSYKDAMFDLAEILFEEKEFVEAKKFYNLYIEASNRAIVDQDIELSKIEAFAKLELIEKTEKAIAKEKLKQQKLEKKLKKAQEKSEVKATEKCDLEYMLSEADKMLRDKNYKESKKKFSEIKAHLEGNIKKFDFLILDERNIIFFVKSIWGIGNCLFGLNRLAGANNLYKEALNCIEAYITNRNEFDELIACRYSIEADAKAIANKLNLETADTEIDDQPMVATQKPTQKKVKKKNKPAKLSSVFGSEIEREVLKAEIPDRAMFILNILKKSGIVLYIYGGFIRDSLLGIPHDDIDIISKAPLQEIKKTLEQYFNKNVDVDPKYIPKKIQLKNNLQGVVIHFPDKEKIDITTFRDYDDKTQYDPIKSGDFVTQSRTYDVTINGLLLDPFTKEIIDLVGGVFDLREKKLRVNDPEVFFKLDPARMLRVIRFAAQFPDFTIVDQDKIFKYMDEYCYMLNDLRKISRGKLFVEVSALFSKGRGLAAYKLLKTTKLLPFLFPHFPVLKSQGYLETKFFSFDRFIEKVLEKAKEAPKPEYYGLPLLFAVILWPLLLDQLHKSDKRFALAEVKVRKLQVFDISDEIWRKIRLIWVIHYYKAVPLFMNNVETHFMARTFGELAAEADKDWKDVKKMLAEKKQASFQYSEISQLSQLFSRERPAEIYPAEETVTKTVGNML